MQQVFQKGQIVRFTDAIVKMAPAYAGRLYTVVSITATWEIGQPNTWCGEYVIESADGDQSITNQGCLVAA